ncbi:Protein arginine N-methyltransferase [Mycena sanguinolenta]|uniref:Protein arginine N-methyltransferase n=1 Tax=Mycena sanguinolenta TaxID=230812 RepID=A0A8H6YYM8_9AGAR|nr:Protein arginine N-methyltransferase [Mycena sanguinolenta]
MESQSPILSTHKSSFDESTIEPKWDTGSARSESELVDVKDTQRIRWPLAVVVGQTLLLALSLGMFSAVRARGYIPLSPELAVFVQQNPQLKTYGVTFLSTALSAFSSYLFSQAIRQMILVYLTSPMTMSTLRLGISVSSRSLLFDFQNIKGLLATSVFFLATLGQTASWSSLFTPNDIAVYTPMHGTEIDFSSEAFLDQYPQVYGNLSEYLGSALLSVTDTSGAASAMSLLGYPTVLDYAGFGFVGSISTGSTGGIFPIVISANRTNFLTYYDSPLPPFYTSYNVTMSQQGLTATVSCQDRTGQLDAISDPPFQRLATQTEVVIGNQTASVTVLSFKSACSGVTESTDYYLSATNDTVIALACPQNDTSGGYMNTYSTHFITIFWHK